MPNYYAPALDKGLDILEFLSAQSVPQSQAEIAIGTNRTSNEIYRMLICLEDRGYINKEPISGKYQLTLRLFQLAHHHSPIDSLVKASHVHLEQLAQTIKQSCHLSIAHQNQLLIVSQAKSMTPISLSVEVGGIFPITKTISGKIILSHKNEMELKQILKSSDDYTAMSANDKKAFLSELKDFKKLDCVVSKSALTEGVTDFAAPVFDIHNNVIAVLDVSTLTSQMRKFVSHDIITKEIANTVKKISCSLGARE